MWCSETVKLCINALFDVAFMLVTLTSLLLLLAALQVGFNALEGACLLYQVPAVRASHWSHDWKPCLLLIGHFDRELPLTGLISLLGAR